MTPPDDWREACLSNDLPEAGTLAVTLDEQVFCLYRVEGATYATADRCSHGRGSLSEGVLEAHTIECPFHQGCFDIRTGAPTALPCNRPVKTYGTREAEGVIWLNTTPRDVAGQP